MNTLEKQYLSEIEDAIANLWTSVNVYSGPNKDKVELIKALQAICRNEDLDCTMWLRVVETNS